MTKPKTKTTTTTTRRTIAEAAEQLHCAEMTVRRLIASGDLPAVRIGKTALIRIEQADIDALLHPVTGTA
ncbi:helix-turn-helix domain-containing protein [Rhodococcus sp. ACPA1]|uniref:helix-turn-helix domain-containing protein n=1 Tax=Rhodococcus sp. ACPA1 TaxID=2028572 RepID=UPI000BB11A26|nr:helix-turn-helix domain-containing protein [Rhodococcus sp. ACPA1]PBC57038.1 helix-turn-helix domain-containing protein [Rhodococcus sp. ACPA1]